jgi:diguanylate cyclase (GGDEF)-like protein
MNTKMTPDEFASEFARLYQGAPEEAFRYAKTVGEEKSIKNPQTRQNALYEYSIGLFYSARYDEAERTLKSFVFDYRKYPFLPFYVDCFDVLALIEFYQKRYHLSIFYAQQALALAEEKKFLRRLSAIYSNLAAPYHELQQNETCLVYLDKALLHAEESDDPTVKVSILFNRSEILLSLGRYEEARDAILEVEKRAPESSLPPLFMDFLPLCKAEIAMALHEKVDLHGLAMAFLASPYQKDQSLLSYLLDEDESLYDLLRANHLAEDAAAYLEKIEEIQQTVPSLMTAIFINKRKASLAQENGDESAVGKYASELCALYEKQNELFAKDFDEITKMHFDYVRVSSAYEKAQKRARRLQEESDTDALTGLPNRRALEKEKKRFPLLAKKEAYFVLALLDYDHFKDINDGHGYQTGDNALKLGGEFFKTFESPSLRVFRYGGDEFVFAFAAKDPKEAALLFHKLKAGLEKIDLRDAEGVKISLSCCIGYALFPGSYSAYAPALKAANEAIHAAKNIGRGNIVSVLS